MLEISQLSKRYPSQKDHYAVKDLDLNVSEGSLYGLIGPDGAGKSTTLRILSTVIDPTAGSVRVGGFDVRHDPERVRPQIGYMPQLFSLYPDLSVLENMHFFANINHVPPAQRDARIDTMLAFTNLGDFQKRRARNLSGGMKKKLVLACSLIHNPSILILDEPSTGVDPVSRRELWRMLAEVVSQGVTILVSTPYMDEAERCSCVAILYNGKIIAQGQPAALKASLPFDVVELKAKPRKTAREIVSNQKGILDWRPVGDRLRVSVPKGKTDAVVKTLHGKLSKEKADIRILRQSNPLMEDVFTHKVNTLRD